MAQIAHTGIMMIDLPPKVIRTDAFQTFVSQETPIIPVTDEEGQTGTGYCYTIGSGGLAIISLLKDTLVSRLIDPEAEEIDDIWRDLLFPTHATAVGAIPSWALAAIDTALWDLRCRRAGLPFWQMAGGSKTSVPLYSTEGGWPHISTEDLVADAVTIKEAGFAGSKMKVGKPSIAKDRARLLAVRKAVGDDFMIMVDANQSFLLAKALRQAEIPADVNVHWFEQPIPADDVGDHRERSRHSRVPIAADESMCSLSQFKDHLIYGAASIIQAHTARIGGITLRLKARHLAESFKVLICPHFLMELHESLVCAVPNAPRLEYTAKLDDVSQQPMKIRDGRGIPSDEPSIGIDWSWDIIRDRMVGDTQHQFAKEGT